MHRQAPAQLQQAGLCGVRQPDLHDSVVTIRDRLRIVGIGPDQYFIAIGVARDVLVSIGMAHLTQKIHIDIEKFLAGVTRGPRCQPTHDHIVVRRDVHAVEGLPPGIESCELLVRADLVDEDEFVVSGEDEMIAVEVGDVTEAEPTTCVSADEVLAAKFPSLA